MSKREEGDAPGASTGGDAGEGPVPGLAVFDLDDTLWWPEMYMLAGAPFKKDKRTGEVSDRRGEVVNLHKGVREILLDIYESPRFTGTKIAYASRTDYPEWAYECMKLIDLKPGLSMHDVMSFSEVYPGNKDAHLRRMAKDSGVALQDMIFFDNEMRNCRTVSSLGVTCVYTPDGMSIAKWKEGLSKFAEAKARAASGVPNGSSKGKGKGKSKKGR